MLSIMVTNIKVLYLQINTFIYTRVCIYLSALYDITSAEGFKIMITTTATVLIGCHLLACADSPT